MTWRARDVGASLRAENPITTRAVSSIFRPRGRDPFEAEVTRTLARLEAERESRLAQATGIHVVPPGAWGSRRDPDRADPPRQLSARKILDPPGGTGSDAAMSDSLDPARHFSDSVLKSLTLGH